MPKHRPRFLQRYLCAMLLTTLALALKLAIFPLSQAEVPFLLFFAAVMLSAYWGGLGPGLLATVLSAVASNFFFMPPLRQFGFVSAAQGVHLYVFVGEAVIASWLCGRLYASRLRIQHSAAEQLAIRIAETSESEKRRIGQDLHDGLGQILTAIGLRCKSLETHLEAQASPSAADATRVSEMVREATVLARELARGLAPVELEENDLPAALGKLAEQVQSLFRVQCVVSVPAGKVWLPPQVALHFYRIAQEAISNAIRHGHASRVNLELTNEGGVCLKIRDNGTGLPDAVNRGKGMGMQVMAYRAQLCHADFTVAKQSTDGTLVTLRWTSAEEEESPRAR